MSKAKKTLSIKSMTATNIAKLWGVTRQAVQNWYKHYGCPRNADGTYDLPAVIAWRESRLRKEAEEEGGGPARERKLEAEAGIAEMRLKVMNDQLVDREQIQRERKQRILAVKEGLLSLPPRACYLLEGKSVSEIRQTLKEEVTHLLNVFAGEVK